MAPTAWVWGSYLLNIALIVAVVYLFRRLLRLSDQAERLVKELDSDSLEHALKRIEQKGFDVTVKPKRGRHGKQKKS